MNHDILVEQFCTPHRQGETDFDKKIFADAKTLDIKFENRILKGYSMGIGKNILLEFPCQSHGTACPTPCK